MKHAKHAENSKEEPFAFALFSGPITLCRFIFLLFYFLLSSPSVFSASPLHEQFDADRAFSHIKKQVEFGPRPSGSEEIEKTRNYLINELRSYGLTVREQAFTRNTPRGKIRFVNILARLPEKSSFSFWKKSKPLILIGSHYDTKWLPKIRFVGANDGASSTGTLLEIARVIAQSNFRLSDADIEFALFDGEEAMVNYDSKDGLYGSRYYVEQLRSESPKGKITGIKTVIVMDMIGDRDLFIKIPQGDPDLTGRIFDAAQSLDYRNSFGYLPLPVIDDHFPFVLEEIPAVDLIDFEYGPNNRWWHTPEDTLDKISPKSLKIVGQTVLKMLEKFESR